MKRSKLMEAHIAFILPQADEGGVICEPCGRAEIGEANLCNGCRKHAGLMPSEMRRLRLLEEENGELTKIVADLSLDMARSMRQYRTTGSAESSEACSAAPNGGPYAVDMDAVDMDVVDMDVVDMDAVDMAGEYRTTTTARRAGQAQLTERIHGERGQRELRALRSLSGGDPRVGYITRLAATSKFP